MLVTFEQALEAIQQLQQTTDRISLDLETTGLDPYLNKIITVLFGTPDMCCILDCRKLEQEKLTEVVKHLDKFLCIGHNIKFDLKFLKAKTDIMISRVMDTMIQELIIKGGMFVGKGMTSLDTVASRYGLEASKEARNWFIDLDKRLEEWHADFPPVQITYMEQDIIIPFQIAEKQAYKLAESRQTEVADLENMVVPVIAQVELNGCPLNCELLSHITEKKRNDRDRIEKEIRELLLPFVSEERKQVHKTWYERKAQYQEKIQLGTCTTLPKKYMEDVPLLNLSSPKQLVEVLQSTGVELLSTNETTLSGLGEKHNVDEKYYVCKLLVEWRKANTFIVKFGDKLPTFIHSQTGRIHPSYSQLGARTGRMTCSQPNWQQLPSTKKGDLEPLRSCVQAPNGSKILTADFATIEMCIVAELSQDHLMLHLFENGTDLHSATARFLFNLSEDDNPKQMIYEKNGMSYRDIAKRMNFALVYGGGTRLLAQQIGVDLDTATDLLKRYFATYPQVEKWLKQTVTKSMKNHFSVTVSGRRRYYPFSDKPVYDSDEYDSYEEYQEYLQEEYYTTEYYQKQGSYKRQAKNAPVQGTSADITKFALLLLDKHLPPQAKIIAIIHDEVVVECPNELVDETKQIVGKAMDKACKRYLTSVKVAKTKVIVEDYWIKD